MLDSSYFVYAASRPKQIAWYDNCGHALSGQARVDRVLFLCQQFNLARPAEELLKQLENLPAPTPLPNWAD